MHIYKVVIDAEHSYEVKGDRIGTYCEEGYVEIDEKTSEQSFEYRTVAKINLSSVIGVFEVQE